jgi:Regulator of chromosome condensation (RCC1) repeat
VRSLARRLRVMDRHAKAWAVTFSFKVSRWASVGGASALGLLCVVAAASCGGGSPKGGTTAAGGEGGLSEAASGASGAVAGSAGAAATTTGGAAGAEGAASASAAGASAAGEGTGGEGAAGGEGTGGEGAAGGEGAGGAPSALGVGRGALQISVGFNHTCVRLTSGALRCWGAGADGSLGYGKAINIGDDELPASAGDVDVGGEVTQVSALRHTCALLATGKLRCWGYGADGSLGYANMLTIGDDETPASAGDLVVGGSVTQVAAGPNHDCAVLSGGALRCWG